MLINEQVEALEVTVNDRGLQGVEIGHAPSGLGGYGGGGAIRLCPYTALFMDLTHDLRYTIGLINLYQFDDFCHIPTYFISLFKTSFICPPPPTKKIK